MYCADTHHVERELTAHVDVASTEDLDKLLRALEGGLMAIVVDRFLAPEPLAERKR